ncbi:hypothetical protein MMC29_003878 [Sticta canariensis]|nr:hypothetical protein [Sticta canariensis]
MAHFKDGTGNITEVKLMNGFGFIEYDDPMDARDVVPAFHGSDLSGSRLTVQFARGSRQREPFSAPDRPHPRPRRTAYRMQITGLPGETSWQDLKDFARRSGLDVVYSEVGRERDGKGFVEFETAADLKVAVEKLDNQDFKGSNVRCIADTQAEVPRNERYRSRSPPPRRTYSPAHGGYYNRSRDPLPGRDYSPPRHSGYRRRSPPPRHYEYGRDIGRYRSPPPRAAPISYPDPDARYDHNRDDPYAAQPRSRYDDTPYTTNGYPPRRPRSPHRSYAGYDDGRSRYW